MKKHLLIIPLIFGFLIISETPVKGCFAAPPSDIVKDGNDYNYFVRDYNRAAAIFTGQIIEEDRYRIKFKVSKVWKGNISSEFVMSRGPLPYGNGEVNVISTCDYRFSLGESYLVFAQQRKINYELFSEKRYGKIADEYKALLWSSESGRTKLLKDAEIGIANLDKLSNNQNFKLSSPAKTSTSIFKPADNRRASF